MNKERATALAVELMQLGISQVGVTELLSNYDFDEIERQLFYLPHRKAKRPGAFLIEAVRNKYSPPKEFYAQAQTHPSTARNSVDEDALHPDRSPDAQAQGHRASPPPALAPAIPIPVPEGGSTIDHPVSPADGSHWPPVRSDQQGYREPF